MVVGVVRGFVVIVLMVLAGGCYYKVRARSWELTLLRVYVMWTVLVVGPWILLLPLLFVVVVSPFRTNAGALTKPCCECKQVVSPL